MDAKYPFLSEYEKEELDRISRTGSSLSEKISFHKQLTGELPIAHGCSFTQTIFNGKLCEYKHSFAFIINIFHS